MRNTITLSVALVLALALSGAAHATDRATGLITVQQSQNESETGQQSKPQDQDMTPGCRYHGGENLELLV